MNTELILQRLQELRARLEQANYQDFRALDFVTEIEGLVRQGRSQLSLEKNGPNAPNDTNTTKKQL